MNSDALNTSIDIISSLFNQQQEQSHPDFIVNLDFWTPEFMKQMAQDPKLAHKPLKILTVCLQSPTLFEDLPFENHVIQIESFTPKNIHTALEKAGATDPKKILYLVGHPFRPEELSEIGKSSYGLLIYSPTSTAAPDQFLLQLAQHGLVPRVPFLHRYPKMGSKTEAILTLFEPVAYRIRHPNIQDIKDLVELEKSSWAPNLQSTELEIRQWLTDCANECLAIEWDNKIIAVNYAERIPSLASLKLVNWKTATRSSEQSYPIVRLIALNAESPHGVKGLGDELLEFLLYWRSLQDNVTEVVAITRCSDKAKHPDLSMDDYIHKTNESAKPIDSTLRFHAEHGANIVELIPHYRPEDLDNLGYGVLIKYAVKEREIGKVERKRDTAITIPFIKTREDVKQAIEAAIAAILTPEDMQTYTAEKPFMDMGFDSLRLMELRSRLSQQFDTDIHPKFFFQYGTAAKVIHYFADSVNTYKDWLYNVEWTELPIPLIPSTQEETEGVWVIFADEGEFTPHLVAKLNAYGQSAICIKSGVYFSAEQIAEFTVRADNENDFDLIVQSPTFNQRIRGVIYLWGLFNPIREEPTLDMLQSRHKSSCLGLINLIKALSKKEFKQTPRLFVGSWSLQEEGDSMSLVQWPLTALSKAINTERPDYKLKRVSLDRRVDVQQTVDHFFLELMSKDKEDQVLWRSGKRFSPRLIRVELPGSTPPEFDREASYLLVGGIGLGARLIQWHINRGAKRILFLSHDEKNNEIIAQIEQLKKPDLHIEVHTGINLADSATLERLIAQIHTTQTPLKGVMVFATKVNDGLIVDQSWEQFQQILDLKVACAWNLHLMTKDLPLEHFVLFSAIGPSIDTKWKANRAMGNAFLDALAHYRSSKNLPALAIDWGPWGNQGLVTNNIVEENLSPGLRLLTAEEGLNVLDHIMRIPLPEVVAAPIHWREFFQAATIDRPLFSNMEQEVGLKKSEVVTRFQRARQEEREEIIRQYVRMHLRRILLMGSTTKIPPDVKLAELGLMKSKLIALRNNMQNDLSDNIDLPYKMIKETSTLESLTQTLYRLIAAISPTTNGEVSKHEDGRPLSEPIAIIGMGCRFPKNVNTPQEFFQLLKNGIDAVTEIPDERFELKSFLSKNQDETGRMFARYGSFVHAIDKFDADFFDITPREARYIDPQGRVLLEVCWEALENANVPYTELVGTQTGVFVGITTNDYGELLEKSTYEDAHNAYIGTGNLASAVVGRVSHIMGFQGPNLAIDTACSSSLVALHEACCSLQTGESNIALAGGVQLNILPTWYLNYSKANMMSPDFHCKTFDASANGIVRGEGCAIVVLKRLSDALKDQDSICAVIQATNVNQDGISSGFTVPNEEAQVALIKKAMNKANIGSSDLDYLEAHGTGSILGDPIEVSAIGETYGKNRNEKAHLLLGSVKSNIGHLEAAAGVAGLFKVVLALQNELIPGNLNFKSLNPNIDLNFPAKIVSTNTPWPKGTKRRLAGLSSFAFSGTNAHAIIEEAPSVRERETGVEDRKIHLVALSAKSESALAELLQRYAAFAQENPNIPLSDLAFTTNTGRSHFKYRAAIIAQDTSQFCEKIKKGDYLNGKATDLMTHQVHIVHATHGSYHIDKSNPSVHTVAITPEAPWQAILHAIGEYYVNGSAVDWAALDKPYTRRKIVLPTYPFQRKRHWISSQTSFEKIVPVKEAEAAIQSQQNTSDWMQNLIHAVPRDRVKILSKYLQQLAIRVTEIEEFREDIGFFDCGMDSIMAVEFTKVTQANLNNTLELPKTLLMDHPTIKNLAQHLIDQLFPKEKAETVTPVTAPIHESEKITPDKLRGMSLEEIRNLVKRKG